VTVLLDSVEASNIPLSATDAAGYVGGFYQSWFQLNQRVPPFALLLKICVLQDEFGDVLDIEHGDAIPDQAPDWALRQTPRPGWKPICYMAASDWMAVRTAFISRALPEPWYWPASWLTEAPTPPPATPTIPEAWTSIGAVLWQYANTYPYDLSALAPGFPPPPHPLFPFWMPSRKVRHG
jgi:hypothetical protein